jgi:hypothetical protein
MEHGLAPPKGMTPPAAQWIKAGVIGRVKHLRGEEDLRHAFHCRIFARRSAECHLKVYEIEVEPLRARNLL